MRALCFSSDGDHLISLGGLDDGRLVVWNIEKRFVSQHFTNVLLNGEDFHFRAAICGAFAKNEITGTAFALCALHKLGNIFLTSGERRSSIWHILFAFC